MNIILLSRTLSKLEKVAIEIKETFNVETAVIEIDFTSGPEIYDKIKKQIKEREIGVLVNNVGMCYSLPDLFLSIPDRERFINDMIKCNITSTTMMCSIVLPQMVLRKKGVIINISSITAVTPAANLTVYSASKAFVDKFSDNLCDEYEDQGIIIQSVLPSYVATNMIKNITESVCFFIPTPKQFVESALKTVGYARHTNGYLPHAAVQLFVQFLDFIAPSFLRKLTSNMMENTRNQQIQRGTFVSEMFLAIGTALFS
jgi:17beta-estradiol 17-dehydrogenase / very-long-chain 3-oxoacyl-CoA reductase